jgi:dipeptidyl aminopeptidase/acylaminoacyl peptidase
VIVVGGVSAYSPDGTRFAFTARPANGSAGPDVYVWRTSDSEAHRVTDDHASLFTAWLGDQVLVSRATAGSPSTVVLDPATGVEHRLGSGSMWRPSVGPERRTGVWWEGSVKLASDGFTWVPDEGRLVLGAWPDGTPDSQVLASGSVRDWQVRWDESGTALALWVSEAPAGEAGRLSLFAVDPGTGAVDLAKPLLAEAPAYEGFSLRTGRMAWSAPADGGDTTLEVLGWSGTTVGQIQLREDGVTVVR